MKAGIKWILATLILAVVIHLTSVKLYPNIVMYVVMKKVEDAVPGQPGKKDPVVAGKAQKAIKPLFLHFHGLVQDGLCRRFVVPA